MRIRQMHVGEDILLARHGQRIERLKLDRRTNSMFATLTDGSWDFASNVILPPAAAADDSVFSASDARILVRLILGWIAFSALLMIVGFYVASSVKDPSLLDPSLMYSAY